MRHAARKAQANLQIVIEEYRSDDDSLVLGMCLDGSTKCMAVKLKKLDSDVQASATAHHTKNSCEPLDSLHIEWYITYTLALHLNSAGAQPFALEKSGRFVPRPSHTTEGRRHTP